MFYRRLFLLLQFMHCHRAFSQTAVDIFAQANDIFATNKAAAIFLYEEAIRLDPSVYAFWTNLGHAKIDVGAVDGAILAYQTALRLHPTHAKSHYNLGRAYQTRGEGGLAVACYDRAIAIDHTMVNAHYNKALALQDEGDLDTALTTYQRTLTIDPSHREARLNLCNVLFAQGDPQTEDCYRQVVAVNPTFVRGLVNLAAYYQATVPADESSRSPEHRASNEDQRAVSQETDHAFKASETSEAYEPSEQGRVQEQAQLALSLYQQALQMDPQNTMARHGVASMKQLLSQTARSTAKSQTKTKAEVEAENPIQDHTTAGSPASPSSPVSLDPAVGASKSPASLDQAYVRELFDSYSFHFDRSLAQLEYQSHLLVGAAVGRYVRVDGVGGAGGRVGNDGNEVGVVGGRAGGDRRMVDPGSGEGGSVQVDDGTNVDGGVMGDDGMILGLDLGAGTGLACGPVKAAIAQAIFALAHRGGRTATVAEEARLGERVGIVGVDLSPKMLLKAHRRQCYGDLVTADVVEFVQAYAHRVRCGVVTQGDAGAERETDCAAVTTDTITTATTITATTVSTTTGSTTSTADEPTDARPAATPAATHPTSCAPDTHPLLHFVVAADVFMYLGDLRPVLAAARGVLRVGGVVVFTVEALDPGDGQGDSDSDNNTLRGNVLDGQGGSDSNNNTLGENNVDRDGRNAEVFNEGDINTSVDITAVGNTADAAGGNIAGGNESGGGETGDLGHYALQPSGRIAHSRAHVLAAVREAGLVVKEVRREVPRRDRGRAVGGYLVVAERGPDK